MYKVYHISNLYIDIGGVLFSDRWDHHSRQKVVHISHTNYNSTKKQLKAFGLEILTTNHG